MQSSKTIASADIDTKISDDKLFLLLSILGREKTMVLCSEFGGSSLYIPKQEKLNRELRNQEIINEYNKGVTFRQLRKKYKLSEATLRKIIFK